MSWFGKFACAFLGYMIGGPIGMLLGLAFGHFVDIQEEYGGIPNQRKPLMGSGAADPLEQKHLAFFVCVFSMLAKLAKADGQISPNEIALVERFMTVELALDPGRIKFAKNIFRAARASNSPFEEHAEQFYKAFRDDPLVLENVIDILYRLSTADGNIVPSEEEIIRKAARIFKLDSSVLDRVRSGHTASPDKHYAILGCTKNSTVEEIKRSYRRLVMENHPDRARAQGQPEEFSKLANEKFRAIQEAYERICEEKGIT